MFWDRVIHRFYYTLADVQPHGLSAVLGLLAEAHRHALFPLDRISAGSLLLVVLTCPSGTALRARAEQEFARRGLGLLPARRRLGALLTATAPPRSTELFRLFHRGTPLQRGAVSDLLMRVHAPRLSLFLGRLYLVDPDSRGAEAVRLLVRALGHFGRIPLGTIDFPCYLYRRVLDSLPAAPAPPAHLPVPPPPAWLAALSQEEQRFLACCVRELSLEDRIAVYLALYGELDALQIRCVQSARHSSSQDQVQDQQVRAWRAVLGRMPHIHGLNGT